MLLLKSLANSCFIDGSCERSATGELETCQMGYFDLLQPPETRILMSCHPIGIETQIDANRLKRDKLDQPSESPLKTCPGLNETT